MIDCMVVVDIFIRMEIAFSIFMASNNQIFATQDIIPVLVKLFNKLKIKINRKRDEKIQPLDV